MIRNIDNHCYLHKRAQKFPFLDFHILLQVRPVPQNEVHLRIRCIFPNPADHTHFLFLFYYLDSRLSSIVSNLYCGWTNPVSLCFFLHNTNLLKWNLKKWNSFFRLWVSAFNKWATMNHSHNKDQHSKVYPRMQEQYSYFKTHLNRRRFMSGTVNLASYQQ